MWRSDSKESERCQGVQHDKRVAFDFPIYLAGACKVVDRCCAAIDGGVSLSADAVRLGIATHQRCDWIAQI